MAEAQKLFKRKCYMCHRLSEAAKVGPGLHGVTVKRSEAWLHEWLEDPKAMVEKGDPEAVELVNKYKTMMKKISAMKSEKNRQMIIDYLKDNDIKRGARKSEDK